MGLRISPAAGKTNRGIALLCSVLILTLTSSCSYIFNPTLWIGSKKFYVGPKTSDSETATLIVYNDGTSLISVDGKMQGTVRLEGRE